MEGGRRGESERKRTWEVGMKSEEKGRGGRREGEREGRKWASVNE